MDITDLCLDVLGVVYSYLDIRDQSRVSLVCKSLNRASKNTELGYLNEIYSIYKKLGNTSNIEKLPLEEFNKKYYHVTFIIGNPYLSGSRVHDEKTYKINIPEEELISGYMKSCELLGFNLCTQCCRNYQDSIIPQDYVEKLSKFGINLLQEEKLKVVRRGQLHSFNTYNDSDACFGFIELFLRIVKLSVPKLKYQGSNIGTLNLGSGRGYSKSKVRKGRSRRGFGSMPETPFGDEEDNLYRCNLGGNGLFFD